MTRDYKVISADSHLEIPADRWVHRLPERYKELAPRRIKLEGGGDAQVIDGRVEIESGRLFLKADQEAGVEKHDLRGGSFDDNDGAGPPEQRLREQDIDGVDAELLFPGTSGVTNLLNAIKDVEAYAAMASAYNDWLAEEYCSVAPDRLIGIGLIPDIDAKTAVAELEHCAELGLKAVQVNSFPGGSPHPTPDDDYFWAAAAATEIATTVHVCFGKYGAQDGRSFSGPYYDYPKKPEGPIKGFRDPVGRYLHFGSFPAKSLLPIIVAGVFDRFPSLRIYFAETEVGWIPQWLEHADDTRRRYGEYIEEVFGIKNLERPVSDYARDHVVWGAMHNPFGIRVRHEIGVDNIMWESDFPHGATNWPHSREVIEMMFEGVPADEKHKMLAGNAVRFFRLG